MRLTVEEAKHKLCQRKVDGLYCKADSCMAWRWATDDSGYCGEAGKLESHEYRHLPVSA